jgi:hypothetical protein
MYSTECNGAALRVRRGRRIGFGGNAGEERRFSGNDRTVMTDLKALFSELIRFETELWNAIDARAGSPSRRSPCLAATGAVDQRHDVVVEGFDDRDYIWNRMTEPTPGSSRSIALRSG